MKGYVGDGVYVELREGNDLVLTTEDGIRTTNTIVIEPSTWAALKAWLKTHGHGLFPALAAVALLTGCASVSHQRYSLTPGPNECQFTESRTFLTALGSVVCWDGEQRPIGLAGGPGTSPASITMSAIGSAATVAGPVAGAVILGGKVVEAARVLDGATLNTITSGTVTTAGSVSVTGSVNAVVPPVSVAPIQLLPPVIP